MSGDEEPGELLVSDLDRERAGEALAAAMQQGLITPVEFSERCANVWSARTRTQLLSVLSDLPGGPPPELAPLVLDVPFGLVRREGPWTVPEVVHISGLGQRTVLDFTSAVIRRPSVVVEVTATFSATRVFLPADAVLNVDGLELVAGTLRQRGPRGAVEAARDRAAAPGTPHSRGPGGINGPGWARHEAASVEPPRGLRRLLPGATRRPAPPPIRFELTGRATLSSVTVHHQRPTRRR